MQWVSRAGPSLIWVTRNPSPAFISTFSSGTSSPSKTSSQWAVLLRPHDRNAAQDAPARLVAVIEEGGEPASLVVRGARDEDEMIGDAGAGDEPFVAVDHPVVAFLLRARADHAGIGAAAGRGLGHGEGGAHPPFDDGLEPFVLLCRCAHPREQVHVAVVGRRAI